jgi:tetratricopeptide (TPR) repeat protein
VPLAAKSLGAPLGEAVAEDFDFLRRALLLPVDTLFDGGGSTAFWRPIAHQIYYETVGRLIVAFPGVVAALHAALLSAGTVLLHGTLRRAWTRPQAALAAASPMLAESVRTLLGWPSQFVDLGLFVFVALALHETAARRLPGALAGLLAALLCKEVAVVAGLLLPWWPGLARRDRLRWALGCGALLAVWAAAYLAVRSHAGLALPHGLESDAARSATPVVERLAWGGWNSLRAFASLPLAATPRDGLAAALIAAPPVLAVVAWARRRASGTALRARLPWIAWGVAWFVLASVTLAAIHPLWQPNRHHFGSVGLGIAAVAALGAIGPWLAAALIAARLVLLLMAPGPPARILREPPQTGAFMDFERLVRLQRLMRATRTALHRGFPELPRGARISHHNLPFAAEYAYGGAHALQVWYADTTLGWMRFGEFAADTSAPPVTLVEFEPTHEPQVTLVDPEAMRALVHGSVAAREGRFDEALSALERVGLRADSNARVLRGSAAGVRAFAWLGLSRFDEAGAAAREAVSLCPWSSDARFVLGMLAFRDGDFTRAEAEFDSLIAIQTGDSLAVALRDRARAARAGPR